MKNKFNSILVCGSIVYDRIMNFPGKFSDHILPDKIHILNVSFALDRLNESFGGTGGNIAYNLALLGERPKLLGAAGADFEKYADWLKKNNVNIKNVKLSNQATASCYIMTDRADNQITGFYGGPNDTISKQTIKELSCWRERHQERPIASHDIKKNKILSLRYATLQNDDTLAIISPDAVARMVGYVKIFKRFKVPYIFDPGQQITSLNAKDLNLAVKSAKVLIGNDYEIELILKKLGLKRPQLEKLVEILVITKGEKGSEIYCQGKKITVPPAKPKEVLDPTGAGDAYRAGFIKGLVLGWPLKKCGRLGAVTAAYTVEKYGTQTHTFTWKELAKRYKENFKEEL
ncbi:MAG: carbohydrate kinase family protein [bacterium]|nr:carbohydrate kinase family protein [bacterium]